MPGPMMGDTPSGVVARRMWPSHVASFGRVTHAPADPRALYRPSDEHYYICLGRRPEPQSGFPDGAGREGAVGEAGGGVDVSVIMLAFQQSKSYEKLEVPQIQLIVGVLDIPVVSQRQVPTVLSFVLQVQFLEVVDMPVVLQRQVRAAAVCRQGCQHPCRGAEADPYGSVWSEDHSDSPLQCVDKVVNVLVVRVVQVPQMLVVEVVQIPQLQLAEKIVAIRQFLDKVVACLLVCNNRCLA